MKWYKELSENERKLILYGAIIICVAIFWVFVYKPINESIRIKSNQRQTLQQQLDQMQSSEELLKQQSLIQNKNQRDANLPFISWIDNQLLSNKLSQFVTRSEPKDNQTLILTFESVVFDELISWLQPLEQNFNITVSEADINLIDRSNGLCNARITLEES
jgi:general secretion pathway protein M